MKPAVFLDRDGTLIREVSHLVSVRDLRLLPGSAAAVTSLRRAGFALVLITNQSVLARGWLDEAGLEAIHDELQRRLARRGATLDSVYFCPHHPTEGGGPWTRPCRCRKPGSGMLRQAASDLGLNLSRSYMVGDSLIDVQAARRVGVSPVLVRTGHGRRDAPAVSRLRPPVPIVSNLPAAVRVILSGSGGG